MRKLRPVAVSFAVITPVRASIPITVQHGAMAWAAWLTVSSANARAVKHFIENPRVIVLSYNAQDLRNSGQAKKKFSALDIVEFSGRNGRRIASRDRPQLTSPTRAGGHPRRGEAPVGCGATLH
jgi:hypothetical protein